ncbi:MAG: UDP-N-acetylmuramoyl-tripeptide--D-alanyl-D-alanine ligase [Flavobacteriales bacterium]|nr:UDP-N-acetylmuramoyl-tripeptide--D-alanyl-D-alanine ligase [Flavobacteriales bacterium]
MKHLELIYKKFLESKKISIDSRKDCSNSIFFAIKGENFNGNIYAEEAIQKGALMAIVDDAKYKKNDKYIVVRNSLRTLQKIAEKHKNKSNFEIIAITGTNGKTTTKEIIYNILKSKFKTEYTKGNFNNHIGVPLTILSCVDKNTRFLVLEMGANKKNDIKKLCEISKPKYGIITNIGKAHLEGFKKEENILKTKTELYDYIYSQNGSIFINKDDVKLNKAAKKINKIYYNDEIVNCEKHKSNPFLQMKININGKSYKLKTNFIGDYNINNILAGISVGLFLKISADDIIRSIEKYKPEINRSQLIKKNNTIILDAYNANPTSMQKSIDSFSRMRTQNKKTIIIGDMMELGMFAEKEHMEIVRKIKDSEFENIILCGYIFYNSKDDLLKNEKIKYFKNKKDLEIFLEKEKIKDNSVLIKGSRKMELETLTKFL